MGHRYRREIVKAENVTVITNATATELETTSSAHTVTGIRVECLNGNMFRVRAGRYVLACGALQNARLLLLSDRHAPNGLGNKNDLVGRFFMEHPHVPSAAVLLSESRSLDAYRRYYSRLRQPRFYLRIDPRSQHSEQVLNCSARLDTRASGLRAGQSLFRRLGMKKFRFGSDLSEIEPDIESVLADFEGVLSGINDALREGSKKRPQFRRVNVMTIAEQAPNPNSRVQLGDSLNEFGQPELELDWRLTALDKRSIVRLNTALAQELGRLGLGRLRIPEWVQAEGWGSVEKDAELSKLWWPKSPERVNGGWHHMGTTRMKSTPEEGVCNKDCRVFGVENLHVAGSSLFATSGSAPPTLTIVALSLRLADHLRKIS
jgi:choline dehydrogenase-like flavoprotein